MNGSDDIPQSERRRIMIEERRLETYHGHAMFTIDDTRGGRYGIEDTKQTVIGSSPISYPAQPAGSPWHSDPCPPEPPLGYSVDEQEPVGEMFERAEQSPSSDRSDGGVVGDRPTTDTGPTFPRRW